MNDERLHGIGMLIAWDAAGNVVATLDHLVVYAPDGQPVGLVDFYAVEEAGARLRDVWQNSEAVGSGVWPEWIGGQAHQFRVELAADPGSARARIDALVHKSSGQRREREPVEQAIVERIDEAQEKAQAEGRIPEREPVDISDLVGGPGVPLALDNQGRTRSRIEPPDLPVVEAS